MLLKERIQEDLKNALKEKKELELSVLRMLTSAILNKEKNKRYKISKEKSELGEAELEKESHLDDNEALEVISSEVKKRKEAVLEFSPYAKDYGGPAVAQPSLSGGEEKGKIERFIEKEKRELGILEKYLPEQLSEEEIKKLVKEAIDKTGAKEIKDMGKIMAELTPKVKGKAEGGKVAKIVKELLQQA